MGRGIQNRERKALRAWYHASGSPRPSHKECRAWFEDKFQHVICQSTVSNSLSDRFSYLDDPISSVSSGTNCRSRSPQWPILEQILYEWQQSHEKKGDTVTGDSLIAKATEIWPQIPQYREKLQPHFSNGWLANFKTRHCLNKDRPTILQGRRSVAKTSILKRASVVMNDDNKAVTTAYGKYEEDNIYNMDEIALSWMQALSTDSGKFASSGIKKDTSCISVVACTNSTGTDRLPLWIIGRVTHPRSLRSVNLCALGVVWRSNVKAQIDTELMEEWLQNFYNCIGSRRILLLLDDSQEHLLAANVAVPPSNVQIQYLSNKGESTRQPLCQGIIQEFKLCYRRRWLNFQLENLNLGLNPYDCITIYHSIRWIVGSWLYGISSDRIHSIFCRSIDIKLDAVLPVGPSFNITNLFEEVVLRIPNGISLKEFLDPIEERTFEKGPSHLDEINTKNPHPKDDVSISFGGEDQENEIQVPSRYEALKALKIYLLFKENQENTTPAELRSVMLQEYDLQVEIQGKHKQ